MCRCPAVALALEKLSLIDVAILIDGLALAVGLAAQHLSCIATTIRERDGLRGRILCLDGHGASIMAKKIYRNVDFFKFIMRFNPFNNCLSAKLAKKPRPNKFDNYF